MLVHLQKDLIAQVVHALGIQLVRGLISRNLVLDIQNKDILIISIEKLDAFID